MVVQVALDDSGGFDQTFQVIGGLIGTAEQWATFSDRWKAELDKAPAVEMSHMHDAAGCTGKWYGLTEPQRDAKVRSLAETLDSFGFTAIHAAIDMDGFEKTLARSHIKAVNHPYYHAFHLSIWAAALELWNRGLRERFEIIFDEQLQLRDKAKAFYPNTIHYLKKLAPGAASLLPVEPLFRTDEDFLPLQAADMIAYGRHAFGYGVKPYQFDWLEGVLRNTPPSNKNSFVTKAMQEEYIARMPEGFFEKHFTRKRRKDWRRKKKGR